MGNMLKGLAEMLSQNGNIIDALTNEQAVQTSVLTQLDQVSQDDDEWPPKKDRVKEEIEKMRKKNPDATEMQLQNLVAEKFQNAKWYRGGETDGKGGAKRKSNSTHYTVSTMMVWQVYGYLPKDLFNSEKLF
jgi:hypothetical protein